MLPLIAEPELRRVVNTPRVDDEHIDAPDCSLSVGGSRRAAWCAAF
jgi:hypothetical protein